MIKVTLPESDHLRAELRGISSSLSNKVYLSGGKALEIRLRKFYREKNQEPNKKGWPKKNFWNREGAQKTALTKTSPGHATVTVASPAIAFKLQGGTIEAKRGRYLTIPLTAEAYSKGSPREGGIQDLFVVRTHKQNLFLAQDNGGRLMLHYLLREFTTHEPDKTALPDEDDLISTARKAMQRTMNRIIRSGGRASE